MKGMLMCGHTTIFSITENYLILQYSCRVALSPSPCYNSCIRRDNAMPFEIVRNDIANMQVDAMNLQS